MLKGFFGVGVGGVGFLSSGFRALEFKHQYDTPLSSQAVSISWFRVQGLGLANN